MLPGTMSHALRAQLLFIDRTNRQERAGVPITPEHRQAFENSCVMIRDFFNHVSDKLQSDGEEENS